MIELKEYNENSIEKKQSPQVGEEGSHNDIVRGISDESTDIKEKVDNALTTHIIPSEESIKRDAEYYFNNFKSMLVKLTLIVSIACLIILLFAGPEEVFTVFLLWSGLTLPFWFMYIILNADNVFNKFIKKNREDNIICEIKPSYAFKSIFTLMLFAILLVIARSASYIFNCLTGDSPLLVLWGLLIIVGFTIFLVMNLAIILCSSSVKLYAHGVVSGWKPFTLMFSADPYFIPFWEIKAICVFTPCSFKKYFVMRNGTIAYFEGMTGNLYSNDDKFSTLLEVWLHLRCPEAERFEFSKKKELRMFVTGKPNGRLRKYKPKKNRIKQIP